MTRSGTLPDGFTVTLNSRVRAFDDGRTLVGGAPSRVVHLTERAREIVGSGRFAVIDETSRRLAEALLEAGLVVPCLATLPAVSVETLTVVVPVYDRPVQLARLLGALDKSTQVIVVDDGSPDAEAIAQVCSIHGAERLRLTTNVGPAEARNAGLRAAQTPYVAFVDSDVVVDTGSLVTLLGHFHDPNVAVVAPRIESIRDPGPSWLSRYEQGHSALDQGPNSELVRPWSKVGWISSACLVGRVAALGDGFASGARVAEDVDLVWRLVEAGWRIRYEASCSVPHEHRTRLYPWLRRKAYYGTGAAWLARRHGGNVAPAVLAPWNATAAVALLAQRRWSVPITVGALVYSTLRLRRRLGQSVHPNLLAVRLSLRGLATALEQAADLLLRHWWPLTVVAGFRSRRLRRAAVLAVLLDTALTYSRKRVDLDPVRFVAGRRLDDLAYGAGLWWGAVKARSVRSLLPRLTDRMR